MRGAYEPGAVLATLLDLEGGYRSTPEVDWRYLPFAALPRRRLGWLRGGIFLEDVVKDIAALPEIRLEPGREAGLVRIRSTVPLVVQELGAPSPEQRGRLVEVPYGAVVRAGPLLLAPLDAEQAESVLAGALTLPRVGAGTVGDGPLPAGGHGARRGRLRAALGLALLALVLAGLVAGAGTLIWRITTLSTVHPARVLVHLQGWPAITQTEARDRVTRALREGGFDPALPRGGELTVSGGVSLDGLRPIARRRDAAQLLLLRLERAAEVPRFRRQARLFVLRFSAQTGTTAEDRTLRAPQEVLLGLEAASFAGAAEALTAEALEALLPRLLAELVEAVDLEQLATPGNPFRRHRAPLLKTRRLTQSWQRAQERSRWTGAQRSSGADGSNIDPRALDGDETVLWRAALPDGSELRAVAPARMTSTLSEGPVLVSLHVVVRVERLGQAGEPRVLAYSQLPRQGLSPGQAWAVSADGSALALRDQGERTVDLLRVDLSSGEVEVLDGAQEPSRISHLALSADGRRVAYFKGTAVDPLLVLAGRQVFVAGPVEAAHEVSRGVLSPPRWVALGEGAGAAQALALEVSSAGEGLGGLVGARQIDLFDPEGHLLPSITHPTKSLGPVLSTRGSVLRLCWSSGAEADLREHEEAMVREGQGREFYAGVRQVCGDGTFDVATGQVEWRHDRFCDSAYRCGASAEE